MSPYDSEESSRQEIRDKYEATKHSCDKRDEQIREQLETEKEQREK